eukprot:CAMPEP_0168694488 /NCGR_PEP_ID=MMETSP0503-20121227/34321_1 /TAXON_ID=89963 /ORGANISM="Heterocapsa rotundata, Strain SCCAP K-0483" /LENGTH=96 /DNA_ID=CAMNT_0008740137 /DNA_START=5 /DNA_END=291 /DNA_ORIENTATION=-
MAGVTPGAQADPGIDEWDMFCSDIMTPEPPKALVKPAEATDGGPLAGLVMEQPAPQPRPVRSLVMEPPAQQPAAQQLLAKDLLDFSWAGEDPFKKA